MAGPNLPTNRAVGTPDPAGDANAVHGIVNAFDTGLKTAASGQALIWNGLVYAPANLPAVGGGTGAGSAVVTVAASNTPAALKAAATYVCDGVADEVTIQSALDALPATGGLVQLLGGEFVWASAKVRVEKHGTILAGIGMGAIAGASQQGYGTRIRVATGFTDTCAILVADTTGTNAISTCTVRDMTIVGSDTGTNVHGLFWRGHTGAIDRVRVSNMSGDGIRVEGYATWATYDTMLSRCITSDNAGSGIHCSTAAQDLHIVQCISFNNDAGIQIRAASQQITNCHTYNNRLNVWFNNNGARTKILNLKCEGAEQHGILFDNTTAGTSDVQIAESNFKNNGESLTNTFDHISFGTAAPGHARPSITGCSFSIASPVGGALPRAGIYATGAAIQGLSVASCNFAGSASFGTACIVSSTTAAISARANTYGATSVGRGQAQGIASVANGGTVTINLARVPTFYQVSATVAGQVATVTAATAASLTVSLQTNAGAAVTTAANVMYQAEI